MSNAWVKHFTDMTRGLIPYLQHAKADMKRKLMESMLYKPKHARARPETGFGQRKKRGGTKKKKAPAKKSNKGQKSTKTKSKSKKKISTLIGFPLLSPRTIGARFPFLSFLASSLSSL